MHMHYLLWLSGQLKEAEILLHFTNKEHKAQGVWKLARESERTRIRAQGHPITKLPKTPPWLFKKCFGIGQRGKQYFQSRGGPKEPPGMWKGKTYTEISTHFPGSLGFASFPREVLALTMNHGNRTGSPLGSSAPLIQHCTVGSDHAKHMVKPFSTNMQLATVKLGSPKTVVIVWGLYGSFTIPGSCPLSTKTANNHWDNKTCPHREPKQPQGGRSTPR